MTKIVIVGGGTAGLSVMRNLHRKRKDIQLTIIEPSATHYYQPLWTLVGAGIVPLSRSARQFKDFVPKSVEWIQEPVSQFFPQENYLQTSAGLQVDYDYLVVTAGIQLDWSAVEGLTETLGQNGVCSNYSKEYVNYTHEVSSNLKKGQALFTFPNTPIKCAGAPQKVMYLSEEMFRMNKVRSDIEVKFISAGAKIFGVDKYRIFLEELVQKRQIQTQFHSNLVKVDGANQIATFKNLQTGELFDESFSMLHVTPPMSAPDFIKNSPLANEQGWVDVHKFTTQHNRFANIYSIGDVSSLPNSKTGAAIRKQGPVLVGHLLGSMDHKPSSMAYDGYASCPLVTSRHGCMLAEFDYEGQPQETFPFNQAKERYSMYLLKKHFIPFMYWNAMMKGRY
jgi:sulfide:quinone oxidoreductase